MRLFATLFVALTLTVSCGSSDTTATPGTTIAPAAAQAAEGDSSQVMPDLLADQLPTLKGDPGAEFWSTTAGIVLPAGSWVDLADVGYPEICRPIDESAWALFNSRGEEVSSVTFDRTDSVIRADGTCTTTIAMLGKPGQVTDSFTVSDGTLTAAWSAAELWQGQGAGIDVFKVAS